MLTLGVISSAVSAGHWEKPGIYCSNYNFLATSLLSPPPMCCREIKFQQTSACFQWVSTFRDTYKHTVMLSNWAIILHYVLIEKKPTNLNDKSERLLLSKAFCELKEHDPLHRKEFILKFSVWREIWEELGRILWSLYKGSQNTWQMSIRQAKNAKGPFHPELIYLIICALSTIHKLFVSSLKLCASKLFST